MRRLASLVIGCFVSLVAASASAQGVRPDEYPGRFVDRPLTLRGGGIRIDTRFQHVEGPGAPASNTLGAGIGIGFTDRFELDVSHNREGSYDLYDSGGFIYDVGSGRGSFPDRYGNLYAAGRYRVVDTKDIGLALDFGVQLPLHDIAAYRFIFGVPIRARLGHHFNLDIAPEVQLAFVDNGMGGRKSEFDLNIPVAGVVQLAKTMWLAGNSGVYWANFDLNRFYIPLIFELGFTVKKGIPPIMDIELQGGFPYLFAPGGAGPVAGGFPYVYAPGTNDTVVTNVWMLRANLRFYIQL